MKLTSIGILIFIFFMSIHSCSQEPDCNSELIIQPKYEIYHSEISGFLTISADEDGAHYVITPEPVIEALEELSYAKLQIQKQARNLEILEAEFPNSTSTSERIDVAMQLAKIKSLEAEQTQLIHKITVRESYKPLIHNDSFIHRNTPLYSQFKYSYAKCLGDTTEANRFLNKYSRTKWIQVGNEIFTCHLKEEVSEFQTLCLE